MEATELGLKAVNDPHVRVHLLDVGTMRKIHGTTPNEFADWLRFVVATYLAAVPAKTKLGFRPADGDECNGYDVFIKEHADVIEPIVRDTVEATYGHEDLA